MTVFTARGHRTNTSPHARGQQPCRAPPLIHWLDKYDRNCRQLMFGTDWSMMALEKNYNNYVPRIMEQLSAAKIAPAPGEYSLAKSRSLSSIGPARRATDLPPIAVVAGLIPPGCASSLEFERATAVQYNVRLLKRAYIEAFAQKRRQHGYTESFTLRMRVPASDAKKDDNSSRLEGSRTGDHFSWETVEFPGMVNR